MPITLRKFNAQVKDPETGDMVPAGLLSSDSIEAIEKAETAAVAAVESKQAVAEAAIELKGQTTIASIPADYTELSNEVDDVKTQINNYDDYVIGTKDLAGNATYKEDYYLDDSGQETIQSGFHYSNLIPVEAGKTYFIYMGCGATANPVRIHGYNSSGTWVEMIVKAQIGPATTEYTIDGVASFNFDIPSNISYIRISTKADKSIYAINDFTDTLYKYGQKNDAKADGVRDAIKEKTVDYTSDMTPNKYIATNVAIGETVDLTEIAGGFRCIRLNVKRGDVFRITGHGGTAPKVWCLTDNNNIKLDGSNKMSVDDAEIVVEQSGYLIVNSANGYTTKIEKNISYNFAEMDAEIDYIDELFGINDIDNLVFEQGAIVAATGVDNDDPNIINKRIRSAPFFAAKGSTFKRINNSALGVYRYNDKNGEDYIGTQDGVAYKDYVVQTNCYLRIVITKNDLQSDISVDEAKNYLECKINGVTTEANEEHDRNESIYVPAVPPKTNLVINTVPFDDNTENTLAEIYAGYDELVTLYPDYVTKTDLGLDSSGDYHIYRYDFIPQTPYLVGTTPVTTNRFNAKRYPVIYLDSGVHSNEKPCMRALLNVMTLICQSKAEDNELGWLRHNVKIIVVPMVNPWGYVNNTRYNFNHVNINRNFNTPQWENGVNDPTSVDYRGASPASEIETQYVQAILDEIGDNICTVLYYSYHTHGELTSSHQMTAFDIANYKQDDLQKIGIELAVDITKSGWKNHDLTTKTDDPYIGEAEFMTAYAMSDMYGALKNIPSACPECMYHYYTDEVSGTDWSHKLNCMNAEYVLKTITIGINRLLYSK